MTTTVIPPEVTDLDLEAWYLGEVDKPCQFNFWGSVKCPSKASWLLYPDVPQHVRMGCVQQDVPPPAQLACDYHMCVGRDGEMRHSVSCKTLVPIRLIERIK